MLIIFILSAWIQSGHSCGLVPGLYCGLKNCYDVLGINRDSFSKEELSKSYRSLVKKYHPDKVKGQSKKVEAQERFLEIATAYETLKNDDARSDYDYFLDHPKERYYNYYQYYRRRVYPNVDVRIVIVVTLFLISAFQYMSGNHRYQEALKYVIKQEKYRNQAKELAKERGLCTDDGRKKSKREKEIMEATIREIIEENMDIRGGYKKPSIYDTLLWNIIILPLTSFSYCSWWFKWILNYWILEKEYDDDAKSYLIRKNMGLSEAQFICLSDTERNGLLERELWKKSEYATWKSEKDELEKDKLVNSGRYKRYRRYMKNQASSTISFLNE